MAAACCGVNLVLCYLTGDSILRPSSRGRLSPRPDQRLPAPEPWWTSGPGASSTRTTTSSGRASGASSRRRWSLTTRSRWLQVSSSSSTGKDSHTNCLLFQVGKGRWGQQGAVGEGWKARHAGSHDTRGAWWRWRRRLLCCRHMGGAVSRFYTFSSYTFYYTKFRLGLEKFGNHQRMERQIWRNMFVRVTTVT